MRSEIRVGLNLGKAPIACFDIGTAIRTIWFHIKVD